jgi:hypothetical protein
MKCFIILHGMCLRGINETNHKSLLSILHDKILLILLYRYLIDLTVTISVLWDYLKDVWEKLNEVTYISGEYVCLSIYPFI